jgi:hypothetical protein
VAVGGSHRSSCDDIRAPPPSHTSRTFLANSASQIMAADLFVVADGHVPIVVRVGDSQA